MVVDLFESFESFELDVFAVFAVIGDLVVVLVLSKCFVVGLSNDLIDEVFSSSCDLGSGVFALIFSSSFVDSFSD